jgi:hypothetical protein
MKLSLKKKVQNLKDKFVVDVESTYEDIVRYVEIYKGKGF